MHLTLLKWLEFFLFLPELSRIILEERLLSVRVHLVLRVSPFPDVDQAPGVRCQSEVFRPGQLPGLRALLAT